MSVGSVGGIGASGGGGAALTTPAAGGAAASGGAESAGVNPAGTGQNPHEGTAGSSMLTINNTNNCNMSTQNFIQLHNMGDVQGAGQSQSALDPEMLKKILEMMMVMAVLDALQQM